MVSARACVVIGADGRNSKVAQAVRPEQYHDKPILQWSAYTYLRDLPTDGMERIIRPNRGWAAIPTNDGLTIVVVGWPAAESHAYRTDIEANYLATLELAPEFAERVRAGDPCRALQVRRRRQLLPPAVRPGVSRRSLGRMPGLDVHDVDVGVPAVSGRAHACRSTGSRRSWRRWSHAPAEVQQLLGAAYGNQEAMDDFVEYRRYGVPEPSSTRRTSPHHASRRSRRLIRPVRAATAPARLRTGGCARRRRRRRARRTTTGRTPAPAAAVARRCGSALQRSHRKARTGSVATISTFNPTASSTSPWASAWMPRSEPQPGQCSPSGAGTDTTGSAPARSGRPPRSDRPPPRRQWRRQPAGRTASAWRFAGRALSSPRRRRRTG